MKRRLCAGKPDGSPCSAPAVSGSPYCRHHRPRGPQPFYRRGRFLYHRVHFKAGLYEDAIQRPLSPEKVESIVRGALTDREIVELIRASVAHAMGLPPERMHEVEVPTVIVDPVREQFVQAQCEAFLSAPDEVDLEKEGVPIEFEIRWPAAVPQVPLVSNEDPHPVRTEPVADAPNNKADEDLRVALTSPNWSVNRDEALMFWEGKAATVIYQPPEIVNGNWTEIIDHTLGSLDKRFQQMRGDLTADVIDILFLHWIANGRPNKARITLTQLVEYRGVTNERKNLDIHWRAVRDARSFRLRDEVLDAAILDMDALRLVQPNLFGYDEPPPADYVLVYSPGYFVGRAVAHDPFLSHYTPNILKLNPEYYSVAKRLGRYLRGEWRRNAQHYLPDGEHRYRTWEDHLADAGIEIEDRYKEHQSEWLDMLDRQLDELRKMGGLREWVTGLHRPGKVSDSVWQQQARLYHPQDRKLLRDLPYRNKLSVFLSLKVHLPPPACLDEKMKQYAAGRLAREAQLKSIRQEAQVRRELKAAEGKPKRE